MKPHQARLYNLIKRHGPISQAEIRAITRHSATHVSRLASDMVDLGHLTLDRSTRPAMYRAQGDETAREEEEVLPLVAQAIKAAPALHSVWFS